MELAFYEQVTKQDAANLSYYNIIQGIICICVLIIANKIYMHYKRKFQNMMAALNNKIMLLQSEQAAQLKIINTTKNKVETCAHLNNKTMIIEDDLEKIVSSAANLFQNEELRKEIGQNGQKLIESKYQIESVTKKIIEFIKHIS